jgi:hypothetical protein
LTGHGAAHQTGRLLRINAGRSAMKVLLATMAVAICAVVAWAVVAVAPTSAPVPIPPDAPPVSPRAPMSQPPGVAGASKSSRRAPQHPLDTQASPQRRVSQLLQRATARDRYQAFAILARCAAAMDFDRYVKSLPPGIDAARLRERYGDGSARITAACGDLSTRDVEQRIELAALAADDGVPGAATAWIEQGPYGDRSALTQRPEDPLVVAWVEQAIERVLVATRHSDTEAIGQFGALCLNWEMDDVARVRLLVDAALQRRREDQLKSMLN